MQNEKEKRGLVILDRSLFESEWEYQAALKKYLGKPRTRKTNNDKTEDQDNG